MDHNKVADKKQRHVEHDMDYIISVPCFNNPL